jgi:LysM repeat protein
MKIRSLVFFVCIICSFLVGTAFAQDVPEGFVTYKVKRGDSLGKIAPDDHHELIMKINKFERRHLPIGKEILIPVDFEKASEFTPVPTYCEETSDSERSVHVFLGTQYFGAYEKGQLVFWGPISSGKGRKGTRPGNFKAAKKEPLHLSKLYGRAPMPFSVNLSRTHYFLHQGDLPGYPASHGCTRLLREDAKKIYDWIKINDPVIISRNN